MCHLAARDVPPGGSSSRTHKPVQNEVSLKSDSSPARQFLEKIIETRESLEIGRIHTSNSSYITRN